ncbi:hypothetical protein PIB30_078861, partial [Stylosanthes scabra]|nr:hypothetical protein [Stylosanthes scabra]
QFILKDRVTVDTLQKYCKKEYMSNIDEGLQKGEFLQEMLEHESFYKYKTPFRPQISDYTFVDTLKTGEQASGS